ncbi:MAG: HEAT repeat domain-containing protein [Planctomycetales bacterium]|nr:HEAT repeat domain-containing protein [Planctomycetales bacterium]
MSQTSRPLVLGAAAALGLLFVAPVAPTALAQEDPEVLRLFQEGKDLFLKGKDEEAWKKFEEVLRRKPDHGTALRLREEAGYQFFIELLMKRDPPDIAGKVRNFARFLLAKAEEEKEVSDADAEKIQKWVADLEKGFEERWKAIEELSFRIGQQAAPWLVEALGNEKNDELRTGAVQACIHMGTQIVPALNEAIESENPLVRQNCCAILGAIGDDRAKAELKRVSEDAKERPEIRAYADTALKRVTAREAKDLPAAKEFFLQKAILYYRDHPAIIKERDKTWTVWKWKEGKLISDRVPRWLYHLRLAEEACYDAVELDHAYDRIWPVMVLANLSQWLECAAHLGKAPDDAKEALGKLFDENRGGLVLGFPAGQRVLFQALDLALSGQEPELAEACCDILGKVSDGADLPRPAASAAEGGEPAEPPAGGGAAVGQPLIDALDYADRRSAKRVRYAAASALVSIVDRNNDLKDRSRPADQWPAKWPHRTVEVLGEAAGESGTRTVLVVDPDSQTRKAIAQELTSLGYFVTEAADVQTGLRRAKAFPNEDLIVVNADLAHQETFALQSPRGTKFRETFIDALRDDVRTKEIPIVIAADEGGLDRAKELFQKEAKGYIARRVPPNREELKGEMERVFSEHPASEEKAAADRMSMRGSTSLASIDPHTSIFPVRNAVPSLEGVLGARPDAVRAPALLALGRIGDGQVVPAITRLIANGQDNKPEIRAAAARALGEIFLRSKAPLPQDTFETLLAGLNDAAPVVQEGCGEGLGKIALKDDQRFLAYKARRIHYRGEGGAAAPAKPAEGGGEGGGGGGGEGGGG